MGIQDTVTKTLKRNQTFLPIIAHTMHKFFQILFNVDLSESIWGPKLGISE